MVQFAPPSINPVAESPSIPVKRSVIAAGTARGRVVAMVVKTPDLSKQYHALVAELASAGDWPAPVQRLRARAAALRAGGATQDAAHIEAAADHLEAYGKLLADSAGAPEGLDPNA